MNLKMEVEFLFARSKSEYKEEVLQIFKEDKVGAIELLSPYIDALEKSISTQAKEHGYFLIESGLRLRRAKILLGKYKAVECATQLLK